MTWNSGKESLGYFWCWSAATVYHKKKYEPYSISVTMTTINNSNIYFLKNKMPGLILGQKP